MKRYVCTVATGLLLALVSTGTATASVLPLPGVPGTQETNLLPIPGPPGKEEDEKGSGGQSVDQDNDADVTNEQTNANVLSPPIAIAVLGNAEASNEQSNTAETDIEQENEAEQDSSSTRAAGGCCNGQSQAGEQDVDQDNDADVRNEQTNANVLSPPIAIAVLGSAEASNEQSNNAETDIEQENEAEQDSSSSSGGGNGCATARARPASRTSTKTNDADVRNKQTNAERPQSSDRHRGARTR